MTFILHSNGILLLQRSQVKRYAPREETRITTHLTEKGLTSWEHATIFYSTPHVPGWVTCE